MQVFFLLSSSGGFGTLLLCALLLFINNLSTRQVRGLISQSCPQFQDFLDSKLPKGCSAVLPSNLCLRGIQQFQDSKSLFIISDFKIFTKMFLRQLNFRVLSFFQLLYVNCKGKSQFFFNLQFLLLLNERGLSPESCLAICHPRVSCLQAAGF